ncbi:phage tail tape measure protein [Nonomuraea sp. NPDC026600]|uniref:phage tail tape measure protein n=1 Tax=Nonomuraea sp. NPDC026600 TaxID=3155363 RepID=UPI0033DAAD15
MPLTVGELVAYAQLDKSDFTSGTRSITSDLKSLQSSTSSSMQSMESTVTRSLSDIEKAIADGLDPAAAIADLDRLEAALDQSLKDMQAEADTASADMLGDIEKEFSDLAGEAKADGTRAGKELADGLDDGLKDAPDRAREHGRKSGEGFGDGLEGAGGGGRLAAIGSSLVDSLKMGAMGLAVGAGLAIGQAIMSGLESAMDAEVAKKKLFAQVGATGSEMKKFGSVAGKIYADAYGESMGDVTDAIKSVVQNLDGMGKASESSLKKVSEQAMNVATIMDEDVGKVTEAVAQILRNKLAPNAKAAFDLLVKGTQEGANKSQDLLDTFVEYPTQFRELGLTGKEAMGLISQGLKAGARDADTVADALKEFAIRAQDGSTTSKTAFQQIGLNAGDMFKTFAKGGPEAKAALGDVLDRIRGIEDPVKRNAVAVALFGTKAEDLQNALLALNPDTAVQALGTVKGAAEEAGTTLNDTASSKLEGFKRGLEQNVVNYIGDTALPALEKLGEGFNLSNLDEGLTEVGTKFDETFTSITDSTTEWASSNEETLSSVRDTFDQYFGSVKDLVVEVLDGIKVFWDEWGDEILTIVSAALNFVLSTVGGFIETLKGIFQTIKSALTGDWQGMWDGLGSIVEGGTRGIRSLADSGMRLLGQAMGFNWDDIKARGQKGIDDLVAKVKALPSNLKSIASQAGTWLLQAGRDLINGMINGVREKAAELANAARGVVQSAVDGAKNLLGIHSPSTVFAEIGKWTVRGLIQGLEAENGNVKSTVEKMVDTVKKAFKSKPDVADGLLDFIKGGNDSLAALAKQREELVAKLAAAKEYAKQVAGTAEEWANITGLKAEDLTGAGDMAAELRNKASAINNFANNIKTLAARGLNKKIIQDIIDAGVEKGATFAEMLVGSDGSEIKALNKAQAAVDKASKKLGKASADAMYDVGKKSGEGYLKGLEDSLKKIDKAMEKIVKALVAAIKKELKIKSPSQVMADVGVMTMEGLNVGMESMLGSIISTAQTIISQAVAAAKKAGGTGGSMSGMVAGSLPGDGYTE